MCVSNDRRKWKVERKLDSANLNLRIIYDEFKILSIIIADEIKKIKINKIGIS